MHYSGGEQLACNQLGVSAAPLAERVLQLHFFFSLLPEIPSSTTFFCNFPRLESLISSFLLASPAQGPREWFRVVVEVSGERV